MRVGIDVSQAVYGTGVSDYTLNLVESLGHISGLDLSLFASGLRRGRTLRRLFPHSRLYPFPPTALHYLWNILHLVNVEHFTGPIDVFHASDWTQPPSSRPTVTTVHDLSPVLLPGEMRSGGYRDIVAVQTARLHWAVKECAKIICVSRSTAADLQSVSHVPASRLAVIPEALPSRFDLDPPPEQVATVKKKYHLTDYLISVGTAHPRKNFLRLAQSFIKFRSLYRLPDRLVLAGASGWGPRLPRDPALVTPGYLPDPELAALVKGAAAFVFPSLYEGFGLPLLLAWRQQVPTVTSNVSSLPEVAGKAAVLVNPLDEEAIAQGISQAIKSRARLVAAGTARLSEFSWPDIADKTYSVYKSVCL